MSKDKVKQLELDKKFFKDAIASAALYHNEELIPYWNRKIKAIDRILNDISHDTRNHGPKRVFKSRVK